MPADGWSCEKPRGEPVWQARLGGTPGALLAVPADSPWADHVGVITSTGHGSLLLTLLRLVDGAVQGIVGLSGDLAAVRFSDPLELLGWDTSGHPTDRCTWRVRWRPGSPPDRLEAVGQGQMRVPPSSGTWDWTGVVPDHPGGRCAVWVQGKLLEGRALASTGRFTVVATDALRLHDGARCIGVTALPDVSALAVAGNTVWAGTQGGALVRLRLVVTEGPPPRQGPAA